MNRSGRSCQSVRALAELVGGTLQGDGEVQIADALPLIVATAGSITMIDDQRRMAELADSPAAAAVVPKGTPPTALPTIVVESVHTAFEQIVREFRPTLTEDQPGVSPQAQVAQSAEIGSQVTIAAGATVGEGVRIGRGSRIHAGVHVMAGCRLGEEVTLFPGAVLYPHTVVGNRVIIHACAVLGAYGFGYDSSPKGHQLSPQLGCVVVEDDVEIGAATTIDRGTYGPTTIGVGTKIDNQVMIAHNCQLGRHNLICSQVGIAGSTVTEDFVVLAGQVGVRDHVRIGKGAVLGAKAGVSNDVPPGATMIGIPATPEREQKLLQAALAKLPEMRKDFRRLARLVQQLSEAEATDGRAGPEAAA